jgi:hypothetical protein
MLVLPYIPEMKEVHQYLASYCETVPVMCNIAVFALLQNARAFQYHAAVFNVSQHPHKYSYGLHLQFGSS